jgi:hypothetical protein
MADEPQSKYTPEYFKSLLPPPVVDPHPMEPTISTAESPDTTPSQWLTGPSGTPLQPYLREGAIAANQLGVGVAQLGAIIPRLGYYGVEQAGLIPRDSTPSWLKSENIASELTLPGLQPQNMLERETAAGARGAGFMLPIAAATRNPSLVLRGALPGITSQTAREFGASPGTADVIGAVTGLATIPGQGGGFMGTAGTLADRSERAVLGLRAGEAGAAIGGLIHPSVAVAGRLAGLYLPALIHRLRGINFGSVARTLAPSLGLGYGIADQGDIAPPEGGAPFTMPNPFGAAVP